MDHEGINSPYFVGNTIKLQLKTPYDEQTTDARIIKVFEPFTLSSTMVVRLASSSLALEGDVILKLFDRRFATTIREEREVCPWTSDIEKEYHQFILDGGASKLFTELKANSELAEQEGDDWNDLQFEAYLHHLMLGLYETEVEVYNTLKDLQGNDIPRLLACVTVPNSTCEQTAPISQYVDVPGILLQYIVGVSLSDTAMHAPMECWQSICEDAIRIVHLIGDRGILNQDVKPRNCILHRNMDNGFKVFMIDFALCHFRKEYQDETKWRKWKAMEDEEGAIGYVMQRYLAGGFVYHRSAQYTQLSDDFQSDE